MMMKNVASYNNLALSKFVNLDTFILNYEQQIWITMSRCGIVHLIVIQRQLDATKNHMAWTAATGWMGGLCPGP